MERYFYLEHSLIYQNKFVIRFDTCLFPYAAEIAGSYDILIARLLNLSYANYLRYARDRLGAQLIGINNRNITVLFDNSLEVKAFINLINKRLEYVINEREFPYDYKEENGEIELIPFDENENND